jgi:hypothetical protein
MAGVFSKSIYNAYRRTFAAAPYVLPPVLLGMYIYGWANRKCMYSPTCIPPLLLFPLFHSPFTSARVTNPLDEEIIRAGGEA